MLRRFARDERGNFAIITGLMATVLVGAMGGIMDLSMQWTSQSAVQRAADAAALAGAKALENGTEQDAQEAVQIVGQANLPDSFPPVTFVATIDQTAGTVSVAGKGDAKPFFLNLFQINTLPIGASAQSLIQRKSYIDFYFLLDVSESMNIAASAADRMKLERYTQEYNNRPCAFACHIVEPGWAPISVYQMNEMRGRDKARLRIDVLRSAAKSMTNKILQLNSEPGSLKSTRVGTAGFGVDYIPGASPTDNQTVLEASIDAMSGNSHTNHDVALSKFKSRVGAQGKGSSANDRKKFAILVTDGVRDIDFSSSGLGPINVNSCDSIKQLGIDLAVLEIKYVENKDERFFRERVSSYYNRISPSLKNCASPGLYYQATDSDQAESQLLKMVDDLLTVRRRLSS